MIIFDKLQISINKIYSNCLKLNKASDNSLHVTFLDLYLVTNHNIIHIKLFDKSEFFNFGT